MTSASRSRGCSRNTSRDVSILGQDDGDHLRRLGTLATRAETFQFSDVRLGLDSGASVFSSQHEPRRFNSRTRRTNLSRANSKTRNTSRDVSILGLGLENSILTARAVVSRNTSRDVSILGHTRHLGEFEPGLHIATRAETFQFSDAGLGRFCFGARSSQYEPRRLKFSDCRTPHSTNRDV